MPPIPERRVRPVLFQSDWEHPELSRRIGLCALVVLSERRRPRPHLFDPEALDDEGYTMIEFPQSNERTVPASKKLYEVIQQGRFAHDGDPVLRSHITSAGTKVVGEGWRFYKAASKKRIDAAICCMMGVEQALQPPSGGGFEC